MNRSVMVCSWNVRGLGDVVKCGDVLTELLSSNPCLVLVQETKLSELSDRKKYTFLPRHLNSSIHSTTHGSSGGILTAWTDAIFTCVNSCSTPNSVSIHLASTLDNSSSFVTNVYDPSSPDLRLGFLNELSSIAAPPSTPWLIVGDFNMIRYFA